MSDESEEACLFNPKFSSLTGVSTSGGMPYTDGIQSDGTNTSHQQHNARTNRAGSQQSHESETGELIDYNDEIILSQFHADAIKQVLIQYFCVLGGYCYKFILHRRRDVDVFN